MNADRGTRPVGTPRLRRRIVVTGVVQGVGFRPFVWRLATGLGLDGWVENDSAGVTIEVEGEADRVADFERGLASDPPPMARVGQVAGVTLPAGPVASAGGPRTGFAILDSHRQAGAVTSLPADIATCAACLAEVRDPGHRRHRHPFANCTDCGPRFTIIRALPYDRPATTLARFGLCSECAREYADPFDRRFHAQPISCPRCGPVVWFSAGASSARPAGMDMDCPTGDAAIARARARLRAGAILAIKGVGGFHLACDATSAAVSLLRARKRRPSKPLAVMVGTVAAAEEFGIVSDAERRLLQSPENPIVLLRKRGPGGILAEAVAPGVGHVGVMLPAFPLHRLLLEADHGVPMPPLVMTSGNRSEEPIEHDNVSAVEVLGPLVDGFLLHDRDIHIRCDDSVVRVTAGHVLPIRRSRGHAPLPIRLAAPGPDLIAIGGELKSTIAVARGDQVWLSQHIGDLANPAALEALDHTASHFLALFSVRPEAVVADLHPGYHSARYAAALAVRLGVPLLRVQHHAAHAAALLADHFATHAALPAGPVVIAAFDGSGFHPDGSIAGGEFFHGKGEGNGEGSALDSCARLAPFLLPGGDAAIRHPWRTALALLHAAGVAWHDGLAPVREAGRAAPVLHRQLERRIACTPTTSMGRLFDGVAALVGVCQSVDHEGQAAMALEGLAADSWKCPRDYCFAIEVGEGAIVRISWQGMVTRIVADVFAGVPAGEIAAGFHVAVARMIVEVARAVAAGEGHGRPPAVGLTGGVFQNALLVEESCAALFAAGFEPFCHRVVPPNDGGLALGQVILGRESLLRR